MVCLVLVLSGISSGCGRSPDLQTAQIFQQAESTYARAQTAEEFARVAGQYDRLMKNGFVSGVALYNQGNAWMRAGEPGRAIASWRQAQRYRPRDPWLAANLQSALLACQSTATTVPDTGVAGYVFFWQNWLSYREKFVLATVLLGATCALGVSIQLVNRRQSLRRLTTVAGILTLVAAVSAGWDWYRFDQAVCGVVVVESVDARKGNSESYEPAFTQPLREGTEFTVQEERTGWLNIRLADSGTAWIPSRAAVTW